MALKNNFVNFYDSDFDSRNESTIFDDDSDLNIAFIASPGKSISYILDDSSLNNPSGMIVYNHGKDIEKSRGQKINKPPETIKRVELSCQENNLKNSEEAVRNVSLLKRDFESYSVTTPKYLCKNDNNWVSTAKRKWMPKFGDIDSEIGSIQFSQFSETEDLSGKEEDKNGCIFSSTCLDEFQNLSEEYDWRKMKKRSFFEMDDELEETEPKIEVPISRFNHVYHELSTILEVDSALTDGSVESLINSNKCDTSFMCGSKSPKVLKANDSFDEFVKAYAPSNFPAYVMKVIQNEHIEKFLQEPGILEESELTFLSTDLDSVSRISETSAKKGISHSCYKIKRCDDEESPSLISFQLHELSCMRDCADL